MSDVTPEQPYIHCCCNHGPCATRAETAELERDKALAQAEELDAANTALKRTAEAALAREAALRKAITPIGDYSVDGDVAYLACADTPFCLKGEPLEHATDCAVGIVARILAQPNPAAGKVLVDAARLEALEALYAAVYDA